MAPIQTDSSYLTEAAKQLRISPTLEINELVGRRLAQGRSVVHLGFGEATFPVQKDVLAAHRAASESTSYLPVAGLQILRESISRFQTHRTGLHIAAEQVVIAPGSKPLLFALFNILDGDVLLPRPSWVSYEPQVLHANKRLFWIETDEHDRHTLTREALETAYETALRQGARPRIMLTNSPSNPTGQVFSSSTRSTILEFCAQHNVTLITDEIYSDICYNDNVNTSFYTNDEDSASRVIMTGGLSKTYSAGGWRVGFAIFPCNEFGVSVQKAVLAYASECWSATSAPAQEAAAVAFAPDPRMDEYRRAVTSLHRYCTLELWKSLQKAGLEVAEPKGAFYLYPSFRPYTKQLEDLGILSAAQLSHWLIDKWGVAALPGSAFGEDDNGVEGGRYRLRMATSYLYFNDEKDRYNRGYEILYREISSITRADLPLLQKAIEAVVAAIEHLEDMMSKEKSGREAGVS